MEHPIEQMQSQYPSWSRKVVAEEWLKQLGKEAGFHGDDAAVGAVEAEFGITFDADREVSLSEEEAERIWATALSNQ